MRRARPPAPVSGPSLESRAVGSAKMSRCARVCKIDKAELIQPHDAVCESQNVSNLSSAPHSHSLTLLLSLPLSLYDRRRWPICTHTLAAYWVPVPSALGSVWNRAAGREFHKGRAVPRKENSLRSPGAFNHPINMIVKQATMASGIVMPSATRVECGSEMPHLGPVVEPSWNCAEPAAPVMVLALRQGAREREGRASPKRVPSSWILIRL